MAKKDKKNSGNKNADNKKADKKASTADPRFASIHSDPRFRIPTNKQLKSDLDSRFKSAIEADERFKKTVVVDKYGRKVETADTKKQMEKYYNMGEDSDNEDSNEEEEEADQSSSDSSSSEDDTSGKLIKGPDYARGEGLSSLSESSSDSDSDSDSESSSDSESELDQEEEELVVEPDASDIPLGDETSSFAVVNMDWDNLRAVDLMMTFSSFAPKSGKVLSVAIYPSEFGKEMMANEEQHGPSSEFFDTKKGTEEKEINEKTIIEEDAGEEVDSKQFRKYQLQRLRYYYAVVRCDSVSTAKAIYDQCDGTEFESTANFFDLRYVPDDMEFDDEPKDMCDNVPTSFKPNLFVTDALQHSKVKLTWDETPAERQKLTMKAFSQKDIEEMDFKAYLASDSDSDGDQAAEKYKQLLGDVPFGVKSKSKSKGKNGEDSDDDDVDMEITFTPGLDESSSAAGKQEDENDEENETTIEKYRRKEKERKKKRMEKFKNKKSGESGEGMKSSKDAVSADSDSDRAEHVAKRSSKNDKHPEKSSAELELLLMDDDLTKPKKKADDDTELSGKPRGKDRHKTKSRLRREKLEEAEADFDVADSRFHELFENPEFAIDTTLPQFKKTKAMQKIMDERRRRTQSENAYEAPEEDQKSRKKRKFNETDKSEDMSVEKPAKKSLVSSLVERLKSRAKK